MERKLKHVAVPSSEITPHSVFLSRRDFLKAAGIVSATAFLAACGVKLSPAGTPGSGSATPTLTQSPPVPDNAQGQTTDELGNPLNTFDQITNYNNYYEFSTSKQAVNPLSKDFKTTPWAVEVGGLVQNPKTYSSR